MATCGAGLLTKIQMQRRTSQAWHELIEAWQTSNLTQKEFCAQQFIAYSGFHYWFKKFRERKLLHNTSPGFVPVKITSNTAVENNGSPQIELVLPDGKRVKFYEVIDVEFLRALLS